ncbi:MAG: hypothetical protein Q9195_000487 [Heterodermia aff. obscurata]
MPVRLPPFLLPNHNRNCNLKPPLRRQFHAISTWKSESVDHYRVLGVESDASQSTIKKQFYALSKSHHPDRNPSDPTASERFVKISEAYAVLGQPEKRWKYDREIRGTTSTAPPNSHKGSHSSSAFGSRPASGLSKRRTQFRGPPPSFFRNGGWGAQRVKRQRQAEGPAAAAEDGSSGNAYEAGGGGFGYGQAHAGWSNDVPHFDQYGHRRTQEQQERRWMLRRRAGDEEVKDEGASVLLQFFLVGGIVVAALTLPPLLERSHRRKQKSES